MDRIAKFLAGGIFFLLPLFFIPGQFVLSSLMGYKFMLCFFLGNSCFAILLTEKVHAYLGIIHLVITLATLKIMTPLGTTNLYVLAYWMAAACTALVFIDLEEETQILLFRCLVWGAVVSSIMAFFQAFDLDPLFVYAPNIPRADRVLPIGFLGQTTKHGAFLAIAFGVALGVKERIAALVILAAAILTCSSFTYLALIGVLVLELRYLPKGKLLVVGSVIAGFFTAVLLYSRLPFLYESNGRYKVWKAAIDAWWSGPRFWGYGPGSFGAKIGPDNYFFAEHFQPKELGYGSFLQAHNDYVQAVFEFGIPGLVVILLGAIFLGRYFLLDWWNVDELDEPAPVKRAAQAGMVAILLNSIGNFPLQLAPHYLLAVLFLAILLLRNKKGYN